MQQHGIGVYVNFMSDEPNAALAHAYGPDRYRRLRELKRDYEPTNFFSFNQNINPAEKYSEGGVTGS